MASALSVRPFQSADVEAVISLWKAVLPSSQPWNDPQRVICRKRNLDDGLFLVGECRDRIVATAIGGYDGIRGWIYSMAVAPDCRRQGIGRCMLAECERALLTRGCPKVNLQVRQSNSGVVDFYRRCGYTVEDRVSLGKPLRMEQGTVVDPVPTIRVTETISLSQITWDDKPAYLKYLNETNAFCENMGLLPYPYTDIDCEQWLSKVTRETLQHDRNRNWAVRDANGALIGGVGLAGMRRSEKAELGYWLARPYWGRGIMTDVVRRLCPFAFQQYELSRIYAQVFHSNPASARVMQKAGFELEGTLRSHFFRGGNSYDVMFFGLTRPA